MINQTTSTSLKDILLSSVKAILILSVTLLCMLGFKGSGTAENGEMLGSELKADSHLLLWTKHCQGKKRLIWQQISPSPVNTFLIERSLKGADDFQEIARVTVSDTNDWVSTYHYEDLLDSPAGDVFYRLKCVSDKKRYQYSDIVRLPIP